MVIIMVTGGCNIRGEKLFLQVIRWLFGQEKVSLSYQFIIKSVPDCFPRMRFLVSSYTFSAS